MSMPLLQPWQSVCKSRTVCFFPTPSRGGKHMNIDKRESLGFKVVGQVCNIFHRLFFDVSCCPSRVVNGTRMASEATTPCLVLKYCKNEALDFYAQFRLFSAGFPPGKVETSDFSTTKYGGFAQKVRRFVPKKSDVFVPVLCIFHVFLGVFFIFCRNIRSVLLMLAFIHIVKLIVIDGKTQKIRPKSALEGTRCLVKIFEGSRAFLQVIERVEMGNFRESVQFFGSVSAPRHGLSPLSQYS